MNKTAAALSAVLLGAMLVSGCTPSAHKSADTAKKITGPVALTAHVHIEWSFDPSVSQPNNPPIDEDDFEGEFFVHDKTGYDLLDKKFSGVITQHGARDWYFHLSADKVGRMDLGGLTVTTDNDTPLDCTVTWNPGNNSAEAIGSYDGPAPSQDGCSVRNP